jgi:uncharacterized protein YegP (UPF0339 family)
MPARFAIRMTRARQYYFVLMIGTGTVMTSEIYRRKSEAKRAIELVIAGVTQNATIEDETGEVAD